MAPKTGQERVLVVDDTVSSIDLLTNALETEGYQVLMATTGEKAIKIAMVNAPDLILLDIIMPGIDGFETCRRLKSDEMTKEIPVIFMTGLTETEDKVKGFNLGAVDYITKPLQEEEVLARVSTHLEIQRYRRYLEDKIVSRTLEKDKTAAASKRMGAILDAVSVGVWEYDINSGVLEFDDVMYRLYGISKEQFPDPLDAIGSLIHPNDMDEVLPGILNRINQEKSRFHCEHRIVHPDEQIRHILSRITVERNSEGVPVKMYGADELKMVGRDYSNVRPTIVAIGASAGGLEAIQQFFDNMPQNPGIAFIIVTHRYKYSPVSLGSYIVNHTDMPILTIIDGTKPKVNTIYILPGGKNVVIEEGILKLGNILVESVPTDIDKLFISLSQSEKQNAIGIILSGMMDDGVAGIREIGNKGGMTIAQDPHTAEHPSMPQLAIDTGCIDFSLPVSEMPTLLLEATRRFDPAYQGLLQRLEKLTNTFGKLNGDYGKLKHLITNINSSILSSILILDHNLRIKAFIGPINRILPVAMQDIGRPISDLKLFIDYKTLASDVQEVFRTSKTKEIETIGDDGEEYLVRIALMRDTINNELEYVISFIPISDVT
jgi:chemotaxis response regulator CheB